MEAILSTKVWALEASYFNQMAPLVLNRISDGRAMPKFKSDDLPIPEKDGNAEISANLRYDYDLGMYVFTSDNGSKIARIPVIGTIQKRGYCSYGTQDLSRMLARANAAKDIKGIVPIYDGPGGAVDGTPGFAEEIYQSEKPVVGFVENMAASAHLWLMSQSKYNIGNAMEYVSVGSLGVLAMLVNERGLLKKQGVDVKIMRAEQSKKKALLNSIEPWPEQELESLQAELTEVADDFQQFVARGLKGRLKADIEEIGDGRMFNQADAIEHGLLDGTGSLMDAVNQAAELGKSKVFSLGTTGGASATLESISNSNTNISMSLFKKAAKTPEKTGYVLGANIKALLGYAAKEEISMELSDDLATRFDGAETELSETVQAVEGHAGELKTIQETVTGLEATVKVHETTITQLEGEKQELETKLDEAPAASVTQVTKDKDKVEEEDPAEAPEFETSVDLELKALRGE